MRLVKFLLLPALISAVSLASDFGQNEKAKILRERAAIQFVREKVFKGKRSVEFSARQLPSAPLTQSALVRVEPLGFSHAQSWLILSHSPQMQDVLDRGQPVEKLLGIYGKYAALEKTALDSAEKAGSLIQSALLLIYGNSDRSAQCSARENTSGFTCEIDNGGTIEATVMVKPSGEITANASVRR